MGRIVYATSSAQLSQWLAEWDAPPSPVAPLPITTIAPGLVVDGPAPEFADEHEGPLRSEVPAVTEPAWVQHVIWWQVYPLGFVGAYPADPAPTAEEHRLRRIVEWLDHVVELGASGIALGPIFASRTHGYDTTDHYRIDPRLGDDADFDRPDRRSPPPWPARPA